LTTTTCQTLFIDVIQLFECCKKLKNAKIKCRSEMTNINFSI
jgi:hypothetical protein